MPTARVRTQGTVAVVAIDPQWHVVVCPLDGGDPRPVPGVFPTEIRIGWTADGEGLFVPPGRAAGPGLRADVPSGRKHLWRALMPPDAAGVGSVTSVLVTPDGSRAAYSYEQALSELYLITGLR